MLLWVAHGGRCPSAWTRLPERANTKQPASAALLGSRGTLVQLTSCCTRGGQPGVAFAGTACRRSTEQWGQPVRCCGSSSRGQAACTPPRRDLGAWQRLCRRAAPAEAPGAVLARSCRDGEASHPGRHEKSLARRQTALSREAKAAIEVAGAMLAPAGLRESTWHCAGLRVHDPNYNPFGLR